MLAVYGCIAAVRRPLRFPALAFAVAIFGYCCSVANDECCLLLYCCGSSFAVITLHATVRVAVYDEMQAPHTAWETSASSR